MREGDQRRPEESEIKNRACQTRVSDRFGTLSREMEGKGGSGKTGHEGEATQTVTGTWHRDNATGSNRHTAKSRGVEGVGVGTAAVGGSLGINSTCHDSVLAVAMKVPHATVHGKQEPHVSPQSNSWQFRGSAT